jgi:hypothetical protein
MKETLDKLNISLEEDADSDEEVEEVKETEEVSDEATEETPNEEVDNQLLLAILLFNLI